jgi:hypothetical protein
MWDFDSLTHYYFAQMHSKQENSETSLFSAASSAQNGTGGAASD